MTINCFKCKETAKRTLVAVSEAHGIKDFENKKSEFTIFNSSMSEYHIVLKEDADLNEVYRAIEAFIAAQNDHAFVVDGTSFLPFAKNKHAMINVLVRAIEYGSVTP